MGPNVANPSMSLTSSPASATAAFTARAASENTLASESLENSVAPMPAIAAWLRGNLVVTVAMSSTVNGRGGWSSGAAEEKHALTGSVA